jgi:hypothetical protein
VCEEGAALSRHTLAQMLAGTTHDTKRRRTNLNPHVRCFLHSTLAISGAATLQPDAAELVDTMLALSSALGLAESSENIGRLDPFLLTETTEAGAQTINAATRIADALGQRILDGDVPAPRIEWPVSLRVLHGRYKHQVH